MALGFTPQEIIDLGEFPLLTKHESWERVRLEKIAVVQNGFAFSSNNFTKGIGLPLIRIRDIANRDTEDYYNGDFPNDFLVYEGDILIGMDGDFNLARWKGPKALLNQRVCRIKPTSNFYDQKFLVFVLPSFLKAINEKTSSVTVKHLSSRTISDIPLPLPPFAEQHRIVAKIEELFSSLDKGIESLKTAKAQLKVYRQAVLKYAFEGRLTNPNLQEGELPEGWVKKRIEDLSETIGGIAFKSTDFIDSGKYQVIRMGNVRPGVIRYHESPVFLNKVEEKILQKGLLKPYDVIITQTGTKGKRDYGFTALIKSENLLLNQRLAAIRCNNLLMPEYLLYFTWTDAFKNQFFENETGNVGQGNVGIKGITQSLVPLPSIKEQQNIAQEIESRLSVCDKLEESIEQSLQQAEALRQSILKKAFEGKLVPQDPKDEPAAVLLERIASARLSAGTPEKASAAPAGRKPNKNKKPKKT